MPAKATAKKKAPAKKQKQIKSVQEATQPEPDVVINEETRTVNVSSGVISQWGPFDQNVYVTTPHGDYGLPAGQVLWFEWIDKVDRDSLEIVKVPVPKRRRATDEEIEISGVDLSHMQPGRAFYDIKEGREAPQQMEITINGEGTFPGVIKNAPVAESR